MIIRNVLAVIDYNSNINRQQKLSKDGQGLFKKKVRICVLNNDNRDYYMTVPG